MRILIVEDSEVRTDFLLRQCAGHEVTVATTAQGAIEILEGTPFDLLFLDHDLAEPLGNGMDVARHLRKTGCEATPTIIHSMNIPAAKAMASLLPRSRVYPFFVLKELAKEHTPSTWVAECLAMTKFPAPHTA